MWQNISLNFKITCSLLIIQATTLTAGGFLLVKWVTQSRLNEFYTKLDLQSDAVESGLYKRDGNLFLHEENESIRELNYDKNFYFSIFSIDNSPKIESLGPQAEVRSFLNRKILGTNKKHSSYFLQTFAGEWLVQVESLDAFPTHFVAVAANAQPLLDELELFKKTILFSGLVFFALSILGSSTIISVTTKNITNFSSKVEKLKPPFKPIDIDFKPQSREERILLKSYFKLIEAVQVSYRDQKLFIANASHELKTPIAASLSALETLLARPRSVSEYKETCLDVLKEMQVLRRLSFALLNLASNDLNSDCANEFCCIVDIWDQIIGRWRETAVKHKISFKENLEISKKELVCGSPQQWEVILGNLLDNAIKYNTANGFIKIDVRKIGDRIFIHIEDNGSGMTEEQLGLLGNLFFRADQSRKSDKSFGLGFALTKSTLQRIGGTIDVSSSIGVGTRITIQI